MIDQIYRWYPVYTRSRGEKKAYLALRKKKILAYLPLKKVIKEWSDRKKLVEMPLIQSYLFVYISFKEYMEVLMTEGIASFIYFSGKVASMPDRQIEDLRLLLAEASELDIYDFNIEKGEKVIIRAGPFKGIIGELVSIKNNKKIVLRLEHLGCVININTSMAFIEPLNQ